MNPLVPNIEVEITNSGGKLFLGEDYNLTCTINGADKLNPVLNYGWIQNGTILEMVDNKTNILSFSSFRLSDAGNYSCIVRICSQYISESIVINSNNESLEVQSKPSIK